LEAASEIEAADLAPLFHAGSDSSKGERHGFQDWTGIIWTETT
jgi:hypothetical protein